MHSVGGEEGSHRAQQAGNQSDFDLSEGMVQVVSCIWCTYLLIIWVAIQSPDMWGPWCEEISPYQPLTVSAPWFGPWNPRGSRSKPTPLISSINCPCQTDSEWVQLWIILSPLSNTITFSWHISNYLTEIVLYVKLGQGLAVLCVCHTHCAIWVHSYVKPWGLSLSCNLLNEALWTHWCRVIHICVGEMFHIWSR